MKRSLRASLRYNLVICIHVIFFVIPFRYTDFYAEILGRFSVLNFGYSIGEGSANFFSIFLPLFPGRRPNTGRQKREAEKNRNSEWRIALPYLLIESGSFSRVGRLISIRTGTYSMTPYPKFEPDFGSGLGPGFVSGSRRHSGDVKNKAALCVPDEMYLSWCAVRIAKSICSAKI